MLHNGISIIDPQKTIDNLIYICHKFGLIMGEDVFYWEENVGKLKVRKSRNYLIPFKYKQTIITLGTIKVK